MAKHVQLGVVIGASLSRGAVSIERLTIENFNSGSVQFWLGVYTTTIGNDGKAAAPTAAQVPVIEMAAAETWESSNQYDGKSILVPGPVWVGLSSTENTYTATATTARIDVDYDETEVPLGALTTVVNASTNKVNIFTNASAPNALYDVFVTDLNGNSGVPLYLQLHATDAAGTVNGNVPLDQWPMSLAGSAIGYNTPAGGQTYLNFGRTSSAGILPGGGRIPFSQNALISATAQSAGGTSTTVNANQGCTLAISTTSGKLTLGAAASAYVTARYTVNS